MPFGRAEASRINLPLRLCGEQPRGGSRPIAHRADAGLMGTMGAAVHRAIRLNAVAEDFTLAMRANRCDGMDRAFEAVKNMRSPANAQFEALVVLIAADLAFSHSSSWGDDSWSAHKRIPVWPAQLRFIVQNESVMASYITNARIVSLEPKLLAIPEIHFEGAFVMTCGNLMTRDPKCCLPSDTAVRAAKIMKMENVGAIPVCDGRNSRRLLGIITDRDLALEIVAEGRDPNSSRVENIMSREPITCREDEDLDTALARMESNQIRRIPVVDSQGVLTGIISQADIAIRSHSREKTAEMVAQVSRPR